MKQKEEEPASEARSNIGVRNPFPLAQAILLRKKVVEGPINWMELSAKKERALLEQAFKIPYEHLFDPNPKYESPLYREPEVGGGVKECTAGGYDYTTGDWSFPPAPPPPPAGTFGPDVRQGCSLDCYLIAAIIAFAWSTPSSVLGRRDPGDNHKHQYKFRNLSLFSTSQTLAVDRATHQLVFACTYPDGSTVWPGLYEKAYAVWKQLGTDPPLIENLTAYNPVTALNEVINASTSVKLTASYTSLDTMFTEIKSKGGITTGRTTKPMVAYTFNSRDQTPAPLYSYPDTLMVANHAYAILGTCKVKVSETDKDCIILRNPFGHFSGTPVSGIYECFPTWYSSGFLLQDGNFAITKEEFPHYFEGFAFKT